MIVEDNTQMISKSVENAKVTKSVESTPLARVHPTLKHYYSIDNSLSNDNSIIKNLAR